MNQLRGMAWDHVRGYGPMVEAANQFGKQGECVRVDWSVRSLADFESYPVEVLAQNYDLLLVDHPFIGTGVALQVFEPIDGWLSTEYMANQQLLSVGPSFESYTWQQRQWAIPVDAAAQVAAYRADLLDLVGTGVPTTWFGVWELVNALPPELKVAIPLNPVHAFLSFVTLCAQRDADCWTQSGIRLEVGVEALESLTALVPVIHPHSLHCDPIQMSERMCRTNEVVYVPIMFGYCNYARPGFEPQVIRFSNTPSLRLSSAGAVLGGVGIAVSRFSRHKNEAMNFVEFVTSQAFQCNDYFRSGGQPASRSAWMDTTINAQSNHFFWDTLPTLAGAYVRPRYLGYSAFQQAASAVVHEHLSHRNRAKETLMAINQLYVELVRVNDSLAMSE